MTEHPPCFPRKSTCLRRPDRLLVTLCAILPLGLTPPGRAIRRGYGFTAQSRRRLPCSWRMGSLKTLASVLELGGFLQTPDGELIASGVELALPTADSRAVGLAVDALKLAAAKQSELTPLQAGGLALVDLALLWLLAAN